ncbi:MAG: hypothetical protein P4L16_07735 [Chlamydiales bacterium]|nr:hypothetical protein [Chlamydiales bacterium]
MFGVNSVHSFNLHPIPHKSNSMIEKSSWLGRIILWVRQSFESLFRLFSSRIVLPAPTSIDDEDTVILCPPDNLHIGVSINELKEIEGIAPNQISLLNTLKIIAENDFFNAFLTKKDNPLIEPLNSFKKQLYAIIHFMRGGDSTISVKVNHVKYLQHLLKTLNQTYLPPNTTKIFEAIGNLLQIDLDALKPFIKLSIDRDITILNITPTSNPNLPCAEDDNIEFTPPQHLTGEEKTLYLMISFISKSATCFNAFTNREQLEEDQEHSVTHMQHNAYFNAFCTHLTTLVHKVRSQLPITKTEMNAFKELCNQLDIKICGYPNTIDPLISFCRFFQVDLEVFKPFIDSWMLFQLPQGEQKPVELIPLPENRVIEAQTDFKGNKLNKICYETLLSIAQTIDSDNCILQADLNNMPAHEQHEQENDFDYYCRSAQYNAHVSAFRGVLTHLANKIRQNGNITSQELDRFKKLFFFLGIDQLIGKDLRSNTDFILCLGSFFFKSPTDLKPILQKAISSSLLSLKINDRATKIANPCTFDPQNTPRSPILTYDFRLFWDTLLFISTNRQALLIIKPPYKALQQEPHENEGVFLCRQLKLKSAAPLLHAHIRFLVNKIRENKEVSADELMALKQLWELIREEHLPFAESITNKTRMLAALGDLFSSDQKTLKSILQQSMPSEAPLEKLEKNTNNALQKPTPYLPHDGQALWDSLTITSRSDDMCELLFKSNFRYTIPDNASLSEYCNYLEFKSEIQAFRAHYLKLVNKMRRGEEINNDDLYPLRDMWRNLPGSRETSTNHPINILLYISSNFTNESTPLIKAIRACYEIFKKDLKIPNISRISAKIVDTPKLTDSYTEDPPEGLDRDQRILMQILLFVRDNPICNNIFDPLNLNGFNLNAPVKSIKEAHTHFPTLVEYTLKVAVLKHLANLTLKLRTNQAVSKEDLVDLQRVLKESDIDISDSLSFIKHVLDYIHPNSKHDNTIQNINMLLVLNSSELNENLLSLTGDLTKVDTSKKMSSLGNLGATCYMNASLWLIARLKHFDKLLTIPINVDSENIEQRLKQGLANKLQKHLAATIDRLRRQVPIERKYLETLYTLIQSTGWPYDLGSQQDPEELIRHLINTFEEAHTGKNETVTQVIDTYKLTSVKSWSADLEPQEYRATIELHLPSIEDKGEYLEEHIKTMEDLLENLHTSHFNNENKNQIHIGTEQKDGNDVQIYVDGEQHQYFTENAIPETLLVQIARMHYCMEANTSKRLDFPIPVFKEDEATLTIPIYKEQDNKMIQTQIKKYVLSSAICHNGAGSIDNGHYINYSKNDKGEWVRYNDSSQPEIVDFKDVKNAISINSYYLGYELSSTTNVTHE